MSRLTLEVKDSKLVNVEKLKEIGLSETIVMEKKVVVVIGETSSLIATEIQNIIGVN